MTKAELVEAVAKETGLTKADVQRVMDSTFASIGKTVHEQGRFAVSDFGVFTRRDRKPRTVRNPQAAGQVQVPGFTTVFFRAAKALKKPLAKE